MNTLDELLQTHKLCCVCEVYLLFDSFHKCSQSKDGLAYACKECTSKRSVIYNAETRKNPEKHNREKELKRILYTKNVKNPEYVDNQRQKSRDRIIPSDLAKTYQRNHIDRNPEKFRARNLAAKAIRRGDIIRIPCEICGNHNSEAHHDDYSKPLQVRFLCRTHHMEHHRKYDYK